MASMYNFLINQHLSKDKDKSLKDPNLKILKTVTVHQL